MKPKNILMNLPVQILEELQAEDLGFIVGGATSPPIIPMANTGMGSCGTANNDSGTCSETNDGMGLCSTSNNATGTCTTKNNGGGKCMTANNASSCQITGGGVVAPPIVKP